MNSPRPERRGHRAAIFVIVCGGVAAIAIALAAPAISTTVACVASLVAACLGIRQVINQARIAELRAVASTYAAGDLTRRASISGVGPIARLGSELNELGERLAATQSALESQRRMLDGAIGSLTEGVACIDYLDRLLYANPAWRHLAAGGTGTLGLPYYEHLPAAALFGAIANVRAQGRPEMVEFEHRRRQLQATVSRLDGESLVLVLHDLTELKRLERARRDFVSSVSHELKTPLTAIAGFAETLLDGTLHQDPVAAHGFVEKIARHADRLTVLVRDVLTLSRLEQGAWEIRPAGLALPELIRQLCDEQQAAAAERQVRLVVEGPETLEATTDRELLHQLLGNLLSNAIRYNRPGGAVTIRFDANDERLTVRVSDTGIGIPPEHRDRVFERFYRVDAHRSRASGGTGLGLAIVKQLVDALQGTISLESTSDGTTFIVDLPRTDPRVAPRG